MNSVSQRTREVGLRMSFGATPASVLLMFATGDLKLIAVGLAIGAPSSWAVTRYARRLLYEVTPQDPATMGAVILLFAAIRDGSIGGGCASGNEDRPGAGAARFVKGAYYLAYRGAIMQASTPLHF